MLSVGRLLVVDDHALVRESLLLLLAQRLPGVQLDEAGTLREALAQLAVAPDTGAVLLDLELPDSHGMQTLQTLRARAPRVPVVVLSAHDDAAQVQQALALGAVGFVSKSVDARSLLVRLEQAMHTLARWPQGLDPALRPPVVEGTDVAVAARTVPAPPAPLQAPLPGGRVPAPRLGHMATVTTAQMPTEAAPVHGPADGPPVLALTERQRDVLRLLIDGLPDKLICRELALSHATVKTHLQALFRKLGVRSRAQAVQAVTRWRALSG
ncbi:response regulator transcription factor [Pseudaquabacterium rugosum]|uniref:Response regulator transcription factor n=1 Tax=Pseudaquabacterium rugosum TaxID=2984194 RepID=A0ABU9B6M7_9BURK